VDHAQRYSAPFPWRAATVVVGAVALVELVALIAIGFAQLAPSASKPRPVVRHAAAVAAPKPKPVVHVPAVPLRPRSHVRVLVLNGNGVSGAAATQAARLQGDGYRIAGATNAQRHDYANSMVMYVPGWVREARRLARDTGVRMVSPVDGLRRAQLRGSTVILLLGS
jgi:LytR cell envelope-related transcriptional attenuator